MQDYADLDSSRKDLILERIGTNVYHICLPCRKDYLSFMEDYMKIPRISFLKQILLLALLPLLMACQSLFTYNGATVRDGISVPLKPGGPHTGTWHYQDVTIDFTYTREPKTLHISGDIHLAFQALTDHFFVRLHFIDDSQKIIGTEVIATAGYRTRVETYHFDKTLEVPSGTIAFSYDGEIRGVSDDGSWSFWMDPRKGGALGQLLQ
jgi:hypothetical protein